MDNKPRIGSCFSEDDISCLAESLNEYAKGLSEHEKNTLFEILLGAMDPLDRFRYMKTSDLLSSDEEAVLRSLENESKRG
jgi:hypothetical protein